MPLILGMSILLGCQFLGELLVHALSLPVPGPVVGMVVLLVGLMLNGRVPSGLRASGEGLLRYLTLLFVPAGVGIMVHFGLIKTDFWPIVITLVVSTTLTLAVTAKVMEWLTRSTPQDPRDALREDRS
ncbi:holin-like protein [Chromohalobacter marismortui]|uniref:Holin-like protein n=1 Tax=Chromohalobacter marismortui TaxID=42055 RepID=A0A4R7NX14_9GAMM|nr:MULTISPECIES: CidA/LrgA family protein [Chromohalobacter]MCI0511216.1 CidA/LrgA family protein [Chromohalobacter sp.]MCI0593901.1 CidA/LrgA family protein [Chromohalobacter sp.]TDU25241.1 holin-like protein [Chromohalobacter marismortui]